MAEKHLLLKSSCTAVRLAAMQEARQPLRALAPRSLSAREQMLCRGGPKRNCELIIPSFLTQKYLFTIYLQPPPPLPGGLEEAYTILNSIK